MASFSTPPSRQEVLREKPSAGAKKVGASMRPGADEIVASVTIDPAKVDASRDDTPPDVPVGVLLRHAKRLATRVRGRWAQLRAAKVAPDAAATIEAGVRWLRKAETRWSNLRASTKKAAPKAAREALKLGRDDLLQAAELFCADDAGVQRVLADLYAPRADDHLLDDTERLLDVYDAHTDCFAGTDLTPERVDEIRDAVEVLRDAITGADKGDEAGNESLSQEARGALRLRNRAFWFVAAAVRDVCKRGQYTYRRQPAESALFTVYTTEYQARSKARKRARTAKPTAPSPAPTSGQDATNGTPSTP